jgi:sulfotransferase
MKKIYFVAGLPRSGSTLIMNILQQNPQIHSDPVSGLAVCFNLIFSNWDNIESIKECPNEAAKKNILRGLIKNYHEDTSKSIVFDKDRMWVNKIGILEELLQEKIKILCPVRNPAEILSSFEKIKKNNPATCTLAESVSEASTIASRCYFYAGPNGPIGIAHAILKDAITMGYLDRLLFIDYNRFCNSPKSQTKRIYDFFELPEFEHDFNNIEQKEIYNDQVTKLPGLHKVKSKLEKTTTNCVEYLGLDLYQQYDREVFWDAWI